MPVPSLPEFDQALAVASGKLSAGELAECHGVCCGMLCRHPQNDRRMFLSLLNDLAVVQDPEPDLSEILESLHYATDQQLADEQLRLVLWLPDEDDALELKAHALAQWCNGFLAGLGAGHNDAMDSLSEEVEEALADVAQIARAEATPDGDPEEEEIALSEIIEYIRVVTMMLREELRPPEPRDQLH